MSKILTLPTFFTLLITMVVQVATAKGTMWCELKGHTVERGTFPKYSQTVKCDGYTTSGKIAGEAKVYGMEIEVRSTNQRYQIPVNTTAIMTIWDDEINTRYLNFAVQRFFKSKMLPVDYSVYSPQNPTFRRRTDSRFPRLQGTGSSKKRAGKPQGASLC